MTTTTNAIPPAILIDRYIARHTAFTTLAEMLNTGRNYRPTLFIGRDTPAREAEEIREIAEAYDAAMKAAGDPRRVFRTGVHGAKF